MSHLFMSLIFLLLILQLLFSFIYVLIAYFHFYYYSLNFILCNDYCDQIHINFIPYIENFENIVVSLDLINLNPNLILTWDDCYLKYLYYKLIILE
jgi:hypothetical protein